MDKIKDEITKWNTSIKVGQEFKEKYGFAGKDHSTWNKNWNYYTDNLAEDTNVLTYNIIFGMGRAMIPRVYYRNPKISIKPDINCKAMAEPQYLIFASILEAVDNWLISDIMGIKDTIKGGILDTYLNGINFNKIGYDSEYGFKPSHIDSDINNASVSGYNIKSGERIEYNTNIQPGMPWVSSVDAKDIVVPYGTLFMNNCRWIAHRIVRHIDDIKADITLDNSKDLKPNMESKTLTTTGIEDYFEMWEIRDYKTGKMFIIADGSDKYLYNENDPLQITGLPYECMTFNPHRKAIWGISDVKIAMPQQKEMNEARTNDMLMQRQSMKRLFIEEAGMSPKEVEKIFSGEPVGIIFTKGNPNDMMKEVNFTLPMNGNAWVQTIREDAREITGFSRIDSAQFEPGGRRTAYEVGQVVASSDIRTNERSDIVGDMLTKIITKVNSYIFKFWTESKIISVIGKDNLPYWVEYSGRELEGKYIVSANVENAQPQSTALRKFEAKELFTTLIQDPELTPEARQALRMHLISQYDNISSEIIATMQPGQPLNQPVSLGQFSKLQQGI